MSDPNTYIFSTHRYAYMADAVASAARFNRGVVDVKRFPDGERYIRVRTEVIRSDAVVIGGTISDDDTLELYDLASDPEESRNLASQESELRKRLQEELRGARAPVAKGGLPNYQPGKPTPRALKERLEALGYIE